MVEKLENLLLRVDPYMSYDVMHNELNDRYVVQPYQIQLYWTRKKAREENEGKHAKSFKKVQIYTRLLCARNPKSVVKLDYWKKPS